MGCCVSKNPYTPQSSTPGAPPPLDASADSLLQDYARLAAWEAETQVAAEVSRNTVSLQVRLGAARQAELPGLVAEQRRMAEVAASSAVHTRVAAWRLRLQGDSEEHRRLLEAEVERLREQESQQKKSLQLAADLEDLLRWHSDRGVMVELLELNKQMVASAGKEQSNVAKSPAELHVELIDRLRSLRAAAESQLHTKLSAWRSSTRDGNFVPLENEVKRLREEKSRLIDPSRKQGASNNTGGDGDCVAGTGSTWSEVAFAQRAAALQAVSAVVPPQEESLGEIVAAIAAKSFSGVALEEQTLRILMKMVDIVKSDARVSAKPVKAFLDVQFSIKTATMWLHGLANSILQIKKQDGDGYEVRYMRREQIEVTPAALYGQSTWRGGPTCMADRPQAHMLCFRADTLVRHNMQFLPYWWRGGCIMGVSEASSLLRSVLGPPLPNNTHATIVRLDPYNLGQQVPTELIPPSHAMVMLDRARAAAEALVAAIDRNAPRLSLEHLAQLPRSRCGPNGAEVVDVSGAIELFRLQFNASQKEDRAAPSFAVVATHANHGIYCVGAAGFRRIDRPDAPVTLDDKYHLGSNTKSMTAIAYARVLVQEGPFDFTTTLGELLPHLADAMAEGVRDITAAQLMSHKSGLPFMPNCLDKNEASAMRNWKLDPFDARVIVIGGVLRKVKLLHPPNTKRTYSNLGTSVLGHALEFQAHVLAPHRPRRSCEDLIIEYVLRPLGITTAGFGPMGPLDLLAHPRGHKKPEGFAPRAQEGNADNPPWMGPAGRAHMTPYDYGLYTEAHRRLLSNEDTPMLTAAVYQRVRPLFQLSHDGSNTMNYAHLSANKKSTAAVFTNIALSRANAPLKRLANAVCEALEREAKAKKQ